MKPTHPAHPAPAPAATLWGRPIFTAKHPDVQTSMARLTQQPPQQPPTQQPPTQQPPTQPPQQPPTQPTHAHAHADAEASFKAIPARRALSQVILTPNTRAELEGALSRVRHQHTLFNEWGLKALDDTGARAVLNLYGPPGTGKSMCAEGIAHELGMPLLTISYAELESKFVGETPKNIERAFQSAREQGAVIFFDEADSILGKRLSSVQQSADHAVNLARSVMLLAMDAFEGVVIFATNLAQNYDSAFVRRIQTHVRFELPDLERRVLIASGMLVPSLPCDPEVTPALLAELSDGLSGADLRTVVLNAAAVAVARQGVARRVARADLELAIEGVRRGQRDVASASGGRRVLEAREEVVSPESLDEETPQAPLAARE
jgi:SpoVK/Ycf46/Vps4 family AAA+-type ATPase